MPAVIASHGDGSHPVGEDVADCAAGPRLRRDVRLGAGAGIEPRAPTEHPPVDDDLPDSRRDLVESDSMWFPGADPPTEHTEVVAGPALDLGVEDRSPAVHRADANLQPFVPAARAGVCASDTRPDGDVTA